MRIPLERVLTIGTFDRGYSVECRVLASLEEEALPHLQIAL